MSTFPWDTKMVDRLLKAFARVREELDTMRYALRCANLYGVLLERELTAGEAMLAAMLAEGKATR